MKKELKVSAIREGTVIDHIPTKCTFAVADILDLKNHKNIVSIVTNLPSKTIGKKGMVKVGGKFLTKDEVNKIALVAPKATVNIIKDYDVTQKINVSIPDFIEKIIKCSNPKCVTNMEKDVMTKFYVLSKEPLKIRCYYCERSILSKDINLK